MESCAITKLKCGRLSLKFESFLAFLVSFFPYSFGFRSVIGTMWAVDDSETAKITSTFYKLMLDEFGHLDHTRAAFALNNTMKTVNIPLDQQILYVHLGA